MGTRALIEKVTEMSGFTRSMGVAVDSVAEGLVVLSVAKGPDLTQFNGFFHGGIIAGLADHAAGAAAATVLPAGRIAVTVDLGVNYLAAANGEKLLAEARVESQGSSIVVVTVRLSSVDGEQAKLCSIATVTLKSVAAPKMA